MGARVREVMGEGGGAVSATQWTNVCVWLFSRQEDTAVDKASTFTKHISRARRLRLRARTLCAGRQEQRPEAG